MKTGNIREMRTNLRVPFAEKDEAKRLGARWDPANKTWYVRDVENLAAFAHWLPSPADAAATTVAKPAPRNKPTATAALVKVGSHYFELECACLPWEGCPVCQAVIAAKGW